MTNTELKSKIQNRLSDFFKSEQIPAVISSQKTPEGIDVEIMNVLFSEFGKSATDMYAEFFFTPSSTEDEDEVLYFNSVFTLVDKLEEEWAQGLLEILPIINFYVASGNFAVNNTGELLAYKNCVSIPVSLKEDGFFDVLMANISLSLESCEAFSDMIVKCARGQMSPTEIDGLLTNE